MEENQLIFYWVMFGLFLGFVFNCWAQISEDGWGIDERLGNGIAIMVITFLFYSIATFVIYVICMMIYFLHEDGILLETLGGITFFVCCVAFPILLRKVVKG